MKKVLLSSTAAMMLAATAFVTPALAIDKATFDSRIDGITGKYEPQIKALEQAANALDDDMPSDEEIMTDVYVNFDEWSEVRFSMHIPEIMMDRWEFSMHIPETTFKLRKFSWDVPTTGMKLKDVGFGIKMHIPVFGMERHEWSTKIPEVTMKHRKFSMDIPEVTMKQRDFSFHLPEFYVNVGGPSDKVEEIQSDGAAIQAKAAELAGAMEAEIQIETHAYLTAVRNDAEKQFQFALDTLNAGIGSAPTAEVRAQLETQRNTIIQQRTQVLNEIDAQLNAVS